MRQLEVAGQHEVNRAAPYRRRPAACGIRSRAAAGRGGRAPDRLPCIGAEAPGEICGDADGDFGRRDASPQNIVSSLLVTDGPVTPLLPQSSDVTTCGVGTNLAFRIRAS